MKQQSGRLQALLSLPQERSAKKRHAILSEIIELFRDRGSASARETQTLGEALLKLLPKLDTSDRALLAAHIAQAKAAPTYLVRELAADAVPAVAMPLLASSALLTEEDLMRAIAKGGDERLVAIAGRPNLSKPAQAAIAKSGSGVAFDALLRNKAFIITPDMIAGLIVRARSDERITARLAQRRDVPLAALAELFFSLKSADRIQLTQNLAPPTEPATAKPLEANMTGEATLVRAARSGDRAGLLRALTVNWKLAEPMSERILRDPSCEALAVLCLGLGISRIAYSTLAVLMQPEANSSTAALSQFERFSADGARRIAAEWQRATAAAPRAEPKTPAPQVPMAPLLPPPKEPAPARRGFFGRPKND